MKKILSILIFITFLSVSVYGFDPVFLSNLSPSALLKANYTYTVKDYNGNTINGFLNTKTQNGNEIVVSMKIGNETKKALLRYASDRGGGIAGFYIYNNKGEKIPFYDETSRSAPVDPKKALNGYKLMYSRVRNVRTPAGAFSVTESNYVKHSTKRIGKGNLEMITESNSNVTVDEHDGFPVLITERDIVTHKIINIRDTSLVIHNRYAKMMKTVKIELTSYEEKN